MRLMMLCLSFFCLPFAQAFATDTFNPNKVESVKGAVEIKATEVNDKVERKKFDIKIQVRNLADSAIVFFLGEMHCAKGTTEGKTDHAFFGVGERKMDLKLGQSKEYHFVCTLPSQVHTGKFMLSFGQIYSNPNNDGKTTDKVLAKEVKIVVGK